MKTVKINGLPVNEFIKYYEQYQRDVETVCGVRPADQRFYILYPEIYIQRLAEIEALTQENNKLRRLEVSYVDKCKECIDAYDKLHWLERACKSAGIKIPFKI